MSALSKISFSTTLAKSVKCLVVLCADGFKLSTEIQERFPTLQALVENAAKAEALKGSSGDRLTLITPAETDLSHLIVEVAPKTKEGEWQHADWRALGGRLGALLAGKSAHIIMVDANHDKAVALAEGAYLRSYRFDRHKTGGRDHEEKDAEAKKKAAKLTFVLPSVSSAKTAWGKVEAVCNGTLFARDLVNEPANILTTVEFAKRLEELEQLGIKIEVLDEKQLSKIGMRALLGVGQGSASPSKVVIMRWDGGKAKEAPLAFIGKGVVFDTGGISLKPAGGMEDMKGDMGGAAAVSGLMKALAGRKAKANVIGIVGLVENMPDGTAQRPGDIVKSLSGQTIEIINTDAEGRLVLADLLWYVEETYKPKFMINLATLTGAIIIALGHQHAGLFSNSDDLSEKLHSAGQDSDERVWRLPLGKAYDKLIDSKFADMKNTGGRGAGSITAAQFLQRFVRDVDWAHLDIAGTAMGSPQTDTNKSWASGFGVRLLDQLVQDHYEG